MAFGAIHKRARGAGAISAVAGFSVGTNLSRVNTIPVRVLSVQVCTGSRLLTLLGNALMCRFILRCWST
jgi:hypothetical protein